MKTRIFNLIILDESGSMQLIKHQAVTGVNETIQAIRTTQKQYEEQEHIVSLVTFNSDAIKHIYNKEPVGGIKEISDADYLPGSRTPLYDAMGHALNDLRLYVSDKDKVLVTIITDGCENDSREYNGKAIKALVEDLKTKEWIFTYIGANQDVEKAASTIAVNNVMAFQTTDNGIERMFHEERQARARWYTRISKGEDNAQDPFFED